MDNYQDFPIRQNLSLFNILFIVSQVFGGLAIILIIAWVGWHLGGFSGPSSPTQWFNWHPLLMTLGLIIIQGDSILIYRVLRNEAKPRLKTIHAVLHFTAFAVVVVGLKAVFDSHNYAPEPIPNLYSLHSWIGLTAVIMFSMQFVVGFLSFMYPGVRKSLRSRYLPVHVFGGTMIFLLATCAALIGINEKNFFNKDYKFLPAATLFGNALGVCIVIFAMLVFYLVSQPGYKRIALAEEQIHERQCVAGETAMQVHTRANPEGPGGGA